MTSATTSTTTTKVEARAITMTDANKPSDLGATNMPKAQRSASITTIAVINLIIGFPCLCCAGIMSGSSWYNVAAKPDPNQLKIDDKTAANNPFMQGMKQGLEQAVFIQKELPSMHLINGVMYGMGTVGSLLLFASGIMLLLRVGLGRWVCVLGAALILMSTVLMVAYTAFM